MQFDQTKTYLNLARSFAGESQAGMRYQLIARAALKQGYVELANTIKVIAKNETVHARRFFEELTKRGGNCIDNIDLEAGYPFHTGDIATALRLAAKDEREENERIYATFAKDAKEGTDICEKIKEAKAIKAIGKAGLDTYAGDVTVIANTIIKLENTDVPELPTEEEDTPLILGMTPVINDPLVKISELGVDDGKVSIEGEVIDMEDRELKSGKTLLSFDIYDGTSSMTCKAFLTKDNSKKVIKRIKNAKGLKIAGTAQMDSFSNELTIMANTIVETEGMKKQTRQDKKEDFVYFKRTLAPHNKIGYAEEPSK